MPGDARGYSWPPFTSGNEAAVKHGATSPRRVRPRAAALAERLVAERPWLAQHRRSVDAWATAEAQHQLYLEHFDRIGFFDQDGQQRSGVDRLDRLAARAQSLRNDLAETPMAMAKLLGTLSATAAATGSVDAIEQVRAEGAALLAAYRDRVSVSPAALPEAETGAEGPEIGSVL